MQERKYSIKNWAKDDRPREKLLSKNPMSLSDSELLAILINHGTRDRSAVDLAKEVLGMVGNDLQDLGRLTLKELMKIKGIGPTKAITIAAALELGRRRQARLSYPSKISVKSSGEVASYLHAILRDYTHEVFAVLFLNRANKIRHFEIISQGGITGTVADPRVILKKALEQEATAMILCHNHPSGSLRPSQADEDLTGKIREACRYFDIRLLDHIIVSEEGHYSFADEGLL
ncbi:MAG: DNA repair protein RadC [Puia sp.]|nr:DNA repair protein RadC [Puia sp.]